MSKARRIDVLAAAVAAPPRRSLDDIHAEGAAAAGLTTARTPVAAAVRPLSEKFAAIDIAVATGQTGVGKGAFPYTAENALALGLPLRKFRHAELVVHPYNPRPESGKEDLDELGEQLAKDGQRDPLHVIPYKGGFAIMDGQRRWLVAPMAGIDELLAWVHPAPTDDIEVYLFGQSIHESRKSTTAIDQAVVWGRMLADQVAASPRELAKRLSIDESKMSRALAILKVGERVLTEIRKAPRRFSEGHLYAIAQIRNAVDDEDEGLRNAIEAARLVVLAPDEKPVSARKLDEMVAAYKLQAGEGARAQRRNSVPIAVRGASGAPLGSIKLFHDGRLMFRPEQALPGPVAEELAEKVRQLFAAELQKLEPAGSGGG